jgi:LPXTG-motif cell wall-anchored protein
MPPPRRPDPEPLEVNDVAVVTIGTVLWLVGLALAVLFHGRLEDNGHEGWIWILVAGAGLGLLGIVYLRRRRDAMRHPRRP